MIDPLRLHSPDDTQPLRAQFEREEMGKAGRDTRTATFVASLLFLAFIVLDYFAFPRLFTAFVIIRLCVVILNMLVLALASTRLGRGRPFLLATAVYLI